MSLECISGSLGRGRGNSWAVSPRPSDSLVPSPQIAMTTPVSISLQTIGWAGWSLTTSGPLCLEQGLDCLGGQCRPGCTCPQAVTKSPDIVSLDQGLWYLLLHRSPLAGHLGPGSVLPVLSPSFGRYSLVKDT